jgi:hypothetical protein
VPVVDWTRWNAQFVGNSREYRLNESLTLAWPSPIIGQTAAMSTSDAARGALKPQHPDRPHDGAGDRSSERAPGDRPANRSALIEQLLVAGLDDYFAGQYEQAIHVWTRVFFLDRGHTRARAYIERARGALAERQREAEAHGLQMDVLERASRTLVESFGSPAGATADPLLTSGNQASGVNTQTTRNAGSSRLQGREKRLRQAVHTALVVLAAALLFTAGYLVAERDRIAGWWRGEAARAVVASEAGRADTAVRSSTSPAVGQTTGGTAQQATGARGAELALARARQLVTRGRFEEAGRVLDAIADDDPLRRDADALLAEVQRALLDSALKAREPSTTAGAPVGSLRQE